MSILGGVPLRRLSTAQQVADGLSEHILAGGFAPGERLRESAVAAELGVARNTVREAVRILELGGLVRHEVNRGAVVISPTPESVEAVYTARHRLESAAAAALPSGAALRRIEEAFDELVAVAGTRDPQRIVTVDLAFHAAVVAALGSSRIDAFFAELTRELRFYLMVLSLQDREYEDPQKVIGEHESVLSALRSGQRERAVRAVGRHVEDNAARVQQILRDRA